MGKGVESNLFKRSHTNCEYVFDELLIQGMHIKTTIRHHLIPTRIIVIERQNMMNIGNNLKNKESLHTVGRDVN
jgi:hypothetical protein